MKIVSSLDETSQGRSLYHHESVLQTQQCIETSTSTTPTTPTTPTTTTTSTLIAAIRSFRRSPHAVMIVSSVALLTDMLLYSIIVPVLPIYIVDHFHSNATMVGILFAMYGVGLIVATPIVGVLSDRQNIGRRSIMLIGMGMLAGATLAFGMASALWILFVARIMQGVSAATTWVVGCAMIADVYPAKELGAKLGAVMSVNAIGLLIGPPIGSALFAILSFSALFMVCAGFVAIDCIMRIVLIDEHALVQARQKQTRQRHGKRLTLLRMVGNAELMATAGVCFVMSAAFASLEPILALYLTSHTIDLTSSLVGVVFLAFVIPYMLLSVPVGMLCDKISKKLLLAIGAGAVATAFPLLALCTTIWQVVLGMAFVSMCITLAMTPPMPEITEILETTGNADSYAQGYALFNISYSAGMMVAAFLSGALYNYLGWRDTLFVWSAVCGASSMGMFSFWLYCGHPFKSVHCHDANTENSLIELERQSAVQESVPRDVQSHRDNLTSLA